MNNYIVAISLIALGILIHYAFFASQKEGLENQETPQEREAAAAAQKAAAERAAAAKQARSF